MKSIKIVFLSLLFIGISSSANAQFWKKLKKKAQVKVSKVEDKLLDKLDKTADKKIDETVYGEKKKDSSLKKEKSEVVLPNILFFNKSLTITSVSEETTSNIKLLFNNDYKDISAFYLQSDDVELDGNMYTVVSPNEMTLFIDSPGMKIKQSVKSEETSVYEGVGRMPEDTEMIATGNSKFILGYNCVEYLYKKEEAEIRIWATNDNFPVSLKTIPMLGMQKNSKVKGFVLEITSTIKNNESISFKVTKINENESIKINTSDYKSLGF